MYSELDVYIYGEFELWCMRHKVEPQNNRDIGILRRAYEQGFSGRKLQKALYKVRHPDKYAAQKARWKQKRRQKSNDSMDS